MSVVIEIGALEFEGYGEAEARRAAEEFERTLADLLERHGLPERVESAELAAVRLDTLPAGGDTPEGLGRALARALWLRVAR